MVSILPSIAAPRYYSDKLLEDNTGKGNHHAGFSITDSTGNVLEDNTAKGNKHEGFGLMTGNGEGGFQAGSDTGGSSINNTFLENAAFGNVDFGYRDTSIGGSGTAQHQLPTGVNHPPADVLEPACYVLAACLIASRISGGKISGTLTLSTTLSRPSSHWYPSKSTLSGSKQLSKSSTSGYAELSE